MRILISASLAVAVMSSMVQQPLKGQALAGCDPATLQAIKQELQADKNFVQNACKNTLSPTCQNAAGIYTAIALLEKEIKSCSAQLPPPVPRPRPPVGLTPISPVPVTVKDVSPDAPFGSAPAGVDPAGRVNSLVIDPHNDSILYGAAEMSGVWKSKDGGKSWQHASVGLKSGLTQNHLSLAVDDQNSQRLLYATGDDDGRAGQRYGGLWVSNNAAMNWQYGNLPCGGISSVVFSSGQPFVATGCGIYTTTSQNLASATWQLLPQSTFNGRGAVLAAGRQSLFAC